MREIGYCKSGGVGPDGVDMAALTHEIRLILVPAVNPELNRSASVDDFDVCDDAGTVVGRIFLSALAPEGRPWFWTITTGFHQRSVERGYQRTRDDALRDFIAALARRDA